MKEYIEVRTAERRAAELFNSSEGETIGGIARRISMPLDSPKFDEILTLNREMHSRGEVLVTSWRIRRSYSESEMSHAELVRLIPGKTIEPAGQEYGTLYDESECCEFCGAGRIQETLLHLSRRSRFPARGGFVDTIAKDEWIVSKKWSEVFRARGETDSLFPLLIGNDVSGDWLQLRGDKVNNVAVLSERTKFGISPFDLDETGRFRCPLGHLAGLNILSPSVVRTDSLTGADVYVSDKYVGIKQGLLRPCRLLLVRQAVWRDLVAAGMSDWSFEAVGTED